MTQGKSTLAKASANPRPYADPARYFPLQKGSYEVKPGLHALDMEFGNGSVDRCVFQIDKQYDQFRQAKLKARAERIDKYFKTFNLTKEIEHTICAFTIRRLVFEHPEWFNVKKNDNGTIVLTCMLSGETLSFNKNLEFLDTLTNDKKAGPAYQSTLDALASQVQEDLAVISMDQNHCNWLSAIHLCFPNYWAAEEKIGKNFVAVHEPVAGIQSVNNSAKKIVNAMVNKGPFVRFSWGLTTDKRLNHHPEPPPDADTNTWRGRNFNLDDPKLYLRVERQITWGFPKCNSALFTIRTYLTDCNEIRTDHKKNACLQSAIESMSSESLIYKGIAESKNDILTWLRNTRRNEN